MKVREDLKSKNGIEIRKLLGYSTSFVEVSIVDKRTIIRVDEDGVKLPDTYYIKDVDDVWFLVTRKNIYNLLKVGTNSVVICVNNTVIGIL